MISFRDAWRDVRPADEVDELKQAARDGDAVGFLVRAGELEQAVLDARSPGRDRWGAAEQAFSRLLLAAGHACLASRASVAGKEMDRAADALAGLPIESAEPVRIKAPEGYLHYALDPFAFAEAARRYAADVGAEHAARAVVLGIRSIGTSLSAMAAAALGTERRATLRPRGPSGERRIDADEVWNQLRKWLRDGGDVLIADEGPGATGETFWRVHEWLIRCGVEARRIVLLPSGDGAMPLAPRERRAWFAAARRFAPQVDPDRVRRVAGRWSLELREDLSWGAWRDAIPGAAGLPAAPIHERVKLRAVDADGTPWLIRYAGLGRWGADAIGCARALADVGAGAAVLGAWDGFVVLRWMEGVPLTRADIADPDAREAIARYLSARAGRFRTGEAVDPAPVRAALAENAREALGDSPGLQRALARIDALPRREAVIADARLAPQEWIRGAGEITKVDAMDHGADTRLPGPTDAAWDLAGAAVEWGFDGAELDALLARCAAGDAPDELARAVAAYRPAYAAACLGEMQFARWEAGSDAEARILDAELARYRAALMAELAR